MKSAFVFLSVFALFASSSFACDSENHASAKGDPQGERAPANSEQIQHFESAKTDATDEAPSAGKSFERYRMNRAYPKN